MAYTFCHRDEEYQYNGEKVIFRHDKSVSFFVCSNCFQRLMQAPQSKIIEAYHLAIEKGYPEKAEMLLRFIDEESEEFNDSKTRETRSNMGRKRSVRKTRPPRNKFWPKQTIIPLDSRRPEIR